MAPRPLGSRLSRARERPAPRPPEAEERRRAADGKRNIRLVLQYDGTRYRGWQRQSSGDDTIQAKLEGVLSRMAGEPINVIGASRTDAGVHAQGQVANFHTACVMSPEQIIQYCLRFLPEDIVVRSAAEVPERFHSRYLARLKRYVYRIRTGPVHDVFWRRYEYHVNKSLDLGAMRRAASLLEGTHDFRSFCSSRFGGKSTIRELEAARVSFTRSVVELQFEGKAFLHGMARIMAGTLIEVGIGRVPPDAVASMLLQAERPASGFTAPPRGLCLVEVLYDPPVDIRPDRHPAP